MNKTDIKRYNKIYAKIDSIAKEGVNGIIDYRGYIDEVITNNQFYILQYVLERKYKVNTVHLSVPDIKSEGVYNIIRLATNSQLQDDIFKLYKEYNVYQLGADIYQNNTVIGSLEERVVSLTLTELIVYHNQDEVVLVLDDPNTTLSTKYRTGINYLVSHIQ